MGDRLTPNILRLFSARNPIPYLSPLDKDPGERNGPKYSGVGDIISLLRNHDPDYVRTETLAEARVRKLAAREAKQALFLKEGIPNWNPSSDKSITSDPYRTLFVGRLNYSTTEKILSKEFEFYGPVKSVKIVRNNDKSRGYAFVEFERERDLRAAYRDIDGQRLDGRRIVVDVERGRTVKGWLPRRLGGGLGHTRCGEKIKNQTYPGRDTSIYGRSMIAIPETNNNVDHHYTVNRFPRPRSRSIIPGPQKRARSPNRNLESSRYRDHGRDRERDRNREHERSSRHERQGGGSSPPRYRESSRRH